MRFCVCAVFCAQYKSVKIHYIIHQLCFGKSPENLRFSGLAGVFAWGISVRRMQTCASVFAPCTLSPPRTLYHKSRIRVYARKNAFPDPRNDRIVNITDNRNMKNRSQTLKCSSQTREIVKNGSQTAKCSSQTRKMTE